MHEIQFCFSGIPGAATPRLSVEGRWECRGAAGDVVDQSIADTQLPSERDAYRVHVRLSQALTSVAVDPPRSITLTFASGATLTIWDDPPRYESFHIEPGAIHI
jgi:hypothetical protein